MIEVGIIVAVIIGLIQAIKAIGLPSQFAPIISIMLGVIASYFVGEPGAIGVVVFNGVMYGLMASGLYSGVKATVSQ